MKFYLDFTSVLLLFFSVGHLFAQCPTAVTLCSQDSVDAFPKTYPGCKMLHTLRINALHCDGKLNDIVNLDSLYPLVSLDFLDLHSPSMIDDIKGLSNVRKINNATIAAQKSWRTPLPLDTLGLLRFYFPPDTAFDLNILSKIKHVSRGLFFYGQGELTPHLHYSTDDFLQIQVLDNDVKNKIRNVLPNNLSGSRIGFALANSQNIDFDFGYKVDSIYSITMVNSPNNDFSTWKDIKKIGRFEFRNNSLIESIKQFKCEEIGTLGIKNCHAKMSLGDLFPNLKRITNVIALSYNNNLESIDVLDNCALPSITAIPSEYYGYAGLLNGREIYYISMRENQKLNTCESNYVCRALKRFGDTIYIGSNLTDCNDILLNKTCSPSSTSEDIDENPLFFSPNPVVDILTISPPVPKGTGFRVINLLGNTVKSGELYDRITLGELPSGHYIIMLDKPDKHHPPQAIKIVKI